MISLFDTAKSNNRNIKYKYIESLCNVLQRSYSKNWTHKFVPVSRHLAINAYVKTYVFLASTLCYRRVTFFIHLYHVGCTVVLTGSSPEKHARSGNDKEISACAGNRNLLLQPKTSHFCWLSCHASRFNNLVVCHISKVLFFFRGKTCVISMMDLSCLNHWLLIHG